MPSATAADQGQPSCKRSLLQPSFCQNQNPQQQPDLPTIGGHQSALDQRIMARAGLSEADEVNVSQISTICGKLRALYATMINTERCLVEVMGRQVEIMDAADNVRLIFPVRHEFTPDTINAIVERALSNNVPLALEDLTMKIQVYETQLFNLKRVRERMALLQERAKGLTRDILNGPFQRFFVIPPPLPTPSLSAVQQDAFLSPPQQQRQVPMAMLRPPPPIPMAPPMSSMPMMSMPSMAMPPMQMQQRPTMPMAPMGMPPMGMPPMAMPPMQMQRPTMGQSVPMVQPLTMAQPMPMVQPASIPMTGGYQAPLAAPVNRMLFYNANLNQHQLLPPPATSSSVSTAASGPSSNTEAGKVPSVINVVDNE